MRFIVVCMQKVILELLRRYIHTPPLPHTHRHRRPELQVDKEMRSHLPSVPALCRLLPPASLSIIHQTKSFSTRHKSSLKKSLKKVKVDCLSDHSRKKSVNSFNMEASTQLSCTCENVHICGCKL